MKMGLESINKLLKILIIILFIALAFNTVFFKFDNCNKCSFEIDRKVYNAREFMFLVDDKCLNKQFPVLDLNNLSVIK